MSERPLSVEEVAATWARETFTEEEVALFKRNDPRLALGYGYAKGHAASTRAAVIAELEEAQVQARSAEGYFEFSAWLTERLAQLRAEQANEQTGEGDSNG